jgi:hypothetical protein
MIGTSRMKTKTALCLLAAALLPACTTTKTASNTRTTSDYKDYKGTRYANNSVGEPAPPAEEPTPPSEGPHDVNVNPAYVPSPLLRASAAASP